MKKKLTIGIGIPTIGMLHWRFAADFMALQLPTDTKVFWQTRTMIDTARNALVDKVLQDKDITHLLMIDDDMTFESDMLIKMLERDVDIIGALAFKRTDDFRPCVYKLKEGTNDHFSILPTAFQEVDAVGTGGMLIKREVLEAIETPLFETWYAKDGTDKHWSVDFDFCIKAKAAGYKIHVDPAIKMGHIGEAPVITEQSFLQKLHDKQKQDASIKNNSDGTNKNG